MAAALEDWGQLISFRPAQVRRPTSVDELKGVLEQAHRDGERLRVLGSLHSCSEIVVSESVLDPTGLPKTIEFGDDDATVEATANVTFKEFNAALGKRGKSVTATGGTHHQTLAGLISTATAPASSRHGLYENLEWVELVAVDRQTGKAEERRIERQDPSFKAAVCSLGLLGVLTKVKFRVVDELFFDVVMKVVRLDDVLADLDQTSRTYDFWRINWVPKSEKALLWAATSTTRDKSKADGDYKEDQAEHILDAVFGILDKLDDTGPLLTKPLEIVYDVMALTYKTSRATGPLRNMLPVDRKAPLRVAMAEWSFRPSDLHRVIGECQDYFDDAGWPNIPTEIELTRNDGYLMSPWNLEPAPYVVKLNFMYLTEVCKSPGEKEQIYAHLKGLWEHLQANDIPFKAHWGKINFTDPDLVERHLGWSDFKPLVQPMFMNDYLARRLPAL